MPILLSRPTALVFGFLTLLLAAPTMAQPNFTKTFSPDDIGPGSTTRLIFTITSTIGIPTTDLAFTDALPAGVTIGDPARAASTCGGTLTAPAGGSSITFADGQVAAGATCTISVDVTSSTVGTAINTSSMLTSSDVTAGPATANLEVTTDQPGFSKSFSPSTVPLGSRSTLTFTIDSTTTTILVGSMAFTDVLSTGLEVADPSNASTTCTDGVVGATPGSQTISLSGPFPGASSVAAGATCTVTVDVVASGVGLLENVSSNLTGSRLGPPFGIFTSGFATATIDVTRGSVSLVKEFVDDPVVAGDTTTLRFTLTNFDRLEAATGIAFTDDLGATLTGLVATGLPQSNVCGAGSQISGTGVLSFTGGSLPAEGSCSFDVTLQVPAAAASGGYPNVTSSVTATVGGSPTTNPGGSDTLFVSSAPTLTKTFLTDPVGGGSTVTVEFTLTSNSATATTTDITFQDNLSLFLSGATATSLPGANFCGTGSLAFATPVSGDSVLTIQGANLGAGGSCTFSIDLSIPVGTPPGTYLNQTTDVQSLVGGVAQPGSSASDTLTVVPAPRLTKDFTDDPVDPGDTVTLEFTLSLDESAPANATNIAFTDNLAATLTGLAAVGLPLNNVCGAGSQISGTTNLSFTGGTLAPGDSCTFSITAQVPATAVPGEYLNSTSNVMADVSGISTIGSAASSTLQIAGITFTKSFTDDPVVPGATATLEFTIENTSTTDATNIVFTDNLGGALSGLVSSSGTVNDPCGAGSSISGTNFLIFLSGSLTAGTSCTFSVTLQTPAGAADGDYLNVTSNLTATFGAATIALPPAADSLTISDDLIVLEKEFLDDPVAPGGTVQLEFRLMNTSATDSIVALSFTDDLAAALSGLVAIDTPMMNVCGAGSSITGTSLLTFTAGTLPAGGMCAFTVTLQVPAGADPSTVQPNITSAPTGMSAGLMVEGTPAQDTLMVDRLSFSKSFGGDSAPTGTTTLTFTIQNLSGTIPASQLSFTDDLDAVLSGLVAIDTPMSDVCGTGSQISGTSLLALTGGTLLPGGSCTITVTVQVPAGAAPGTVTNTSSDLFSAGLSAAPAATADLLINPAPTFAKVFTPDAIGVGGISTLTFTIDNTGSTLAATALDFTDSLPAGLEVAATPNASNTCTAGTLTAVAGSGTISYTGGTVAAAAACTLAVDVTPTAAGTLVNTSGALTSSSGSSGTATDTLRADPQPGFAKAFAPNPIAIGTTTTLTFTIDNTGSLNAATSLDFIDALPAGLEVAAMPNASTTCTVGTLTAVAGSGTISYTGGTVAASSSCTVQVDVTGVTPGMLVNTSGALTSSLGSSGTATDTLEVTVAALTFAKAFAPNPIAIGTTTTLTLTIDNPNAADISGLDFSDPLPTGLEVAAAPNASTTCTGGTLTAVAGTTTISYTGGTIPANASCTVSVDILGADSGMFLNTSSQLTSDIGTTPAATDTLEVTVAALTFAKAFAPNPIAIGTTTTLTFTIDNPNAADIGGLDFNDPLPTGLEVAATPNASTTCIGGTLTAVAGTTTISYTGGTIPADASCTVSVDILGADSGMFLNTSSQLTSDAGTAPAATDTLEVTVAALTFAKEFQPDTIDVMDTSTLVFTIDNPNAADIGGLDFNDTLPSGLEVASPANAATTCIGGTLTAVAGSGSITYSGGTVAAGSTCTVSVDVLAPMTGTFDNTSSDLTSDAGTSPPATDTLTVVEMLEFSKSFGAQPVLPGGLVTLTFTIENTSPTSATALAFTDDLDAVIPGLAATDTPVNDVCGAGSTLAGTTTLTLSGGTLISGASCTFDVTLQVPNDAVTGTFTNTTSALSATFGATTTETNAATDDLTTAFLGFEKMFGDAMVFGGQTTTLIFTITNPDPSNAATDLAFTDDLDAALSGLEAIDTPQSDVCGVGSTLTGTSVLTLAGGSLGPGATCTFQVTVMVPEAAPDGTVTNVTSPLSASIGGGTTTGGPADVATATLGIDANAIAIPTLGTWSMALLAGLLAFAATARLRRRVD